MEEKNSAIEKAESLTLSRDERREKIKKENDELESVIDTGKRKKKFKRGSGFNRLRGAVGVLAVSLATLSTGFFVRIGMPTESDMMLDASYKRSLYDAVEQVGSIDLNLSKALATDDYPALSGYLVDIAIESELLGSDIHALPIKDENKANSAKLVNQIGDFSKSLEKKIVRGETVTDSDYETLNELYTRNKKLKEILTGAVSRAGENYEFDIDSGNDDEIISGLNELENISVEYPELIYDGPFSDGVLKREIKGLSQPAITERQAEDKFRKLFTGKHLREIRIERSANETIPSFILTGKIGEDAVLCEIAQNGGNLLTLSRAGTCGAQNLDRAAAEEFASKFLRKLGLTELQPVWYSYFNGAYTINYAGNLNGTIVYPDMVKIKICAETGDIIGFEGTSYYKNHVERTACSPVYPEETARAKVNAGISIETSRLAIIPEGTDGETLCYEFSGEKDGETYFVYISALDGAQKEMFKVIDTEEGSLLM